MARFRTVGGLGVGAPVTLRGVKVGRVEAIRLVQDEWVETDFSIDRERASCRPSRRSSPPRPACSASGARTSSPTSRRPTDPNLRDALAESDRAGGDAWPGATLPDIGQLTAQASRIAGDVGVVTQRISQAFDSTALKNLQKSVKDLAEISAGWSCSPARRPAGSTG